VVGEGRGDGDVLWKSGRGGGVGGALPIRGACCDDEYWRSFERVYLTFCRGYKRSPPCHYSVQLLSSGQIHCVVRHWILSVLINYLFF
jgi:hypothetical protein